MRKISYILICLMSVPWLIQCGKKSAQKVLDEKQFVQVYCDVITYNDLIADKYREAFVDSVLKSHHITRQEFQNTVDVYTKDEKKWGNVFTKIVAELEHRERELEGKTDSTKKNGIESDFPPGY